MIQDKDCERGLLVTYGNRKAIVIDVERKAFIGVINSPSIEILLLDDLTFIKLDPCHLDYYKRDFKKVMGAILNEIPDGFRSDIRFNKEKFERDINYAAPEVRWGILSQWLNSFLPYPPQTDWQKKIADIFCDKIVVD